ncbi:hypothetical protein [Amycolatopsis sp. PS_44_ISF1]|uniref:hypothetical protein n=1 Tax=Amycolatopsis sp. PS_44_ISF1 TaxID=2974917 RepID=UPI0028DF51AC|nr:hypothetical protein [Amycolatopsis sp. PS_44_ISF1]MDT8913370.1 hypothetical protein [Amycolatopsis sp. PS_44_ISF1]
MRKPPFTALAAVSLAALLAGGPLAAVAVAAPAAAVQPAAVPAAAVPAAAPPAAAVRVTPATADPDYATVLEVRGSGFQSVPRGFGGVYLLFGWVAGGAWPPSQGGASGATYRYVPDEEAKDNRGFQRFISFPGGETAASANGGEMTADGSWSTRLVVPGARFKATDRDGHVVDVDCLETRCGLITVGAHGVANANNETFTPVSFAAPQARKPVTSSAPTPTPPSSSTAPPPASSAPPSPSAAPVSSTVDTTPPAVRPAAAGSSDRTWWIYAGIGAVVVLAAVLTPLLLRRRRRPGADQEGNDIP